MSTGTDNVVHVRNPTECHTQGRRCFFIVAIEALTVRMKGAKLGPRVLQPVLEQQAGKDLFFFPEKNKEFFNKVYEYVYHDPFEEPGGDEFVTDMLSWLEERLPS